jgi:hypothetical protein
MDKNRFGVEVRPYVREARIGERGIAFDRLDLDAWVDAYFEQNARAPEPPPTPKRSEQELSDWLSERLNQKSKDAFEKALARGRTMRKKPLDP